MLKSQRKNTRLHPQNASRHAKERIEKLKKEINHHRYLYHVLDKQEISDSALDSLKRELSELEKKYPDSLTSDSPTQRVGGKVLDKFKKVKHVDRMLSLEDVFSYEELQDWEKRIRKLVPGKSFDYFVEAKLDGLTAILTYKDGVFIQGATRGDGVYGEDVTQNLKTIGSIPLKLEILKNKYSARFPKKILNRCLKGKLDVRGEILIKKGIFEKLNKERIKKKLQVYANPRNLAAGSIRQLDPKITASRELICQVYEIYTDVGQSTHEEVHDILNILGFRVDNFTKECKDLNAVERFLNELEKKRHKHPFLLDGAVILANQLKFWDQMGVVGKAPRYMVAYKFKGEEAETVVEDIIVQVGRTGTLTPVAMLRPVSVAGSTISRATLHNEDQIKKLGLKIGDTVIIHKAGDVIPEVVGVLKRLRPKNAKSFKMPAKCPVCGGVIERKPGESAYKCKNKNCFALHFREIAHFVSKKGFDIAGLGPQIIEKFLERGLMRDASDLFKLEKEDIKELEGFQEKSAKNIATAISQSKRILLPSFLTALGIVHIGEETADLFSKYLIEKGFSSDMPESLISFISKISLEELKCIEGVGGKIGESIYNYFSDKKNQEEIRALSHAGIRLILPQKIMAKLAGKTFVLTGTLETMARDEAKRKIKALGGHVSSSVSRNTDFVVAGRDPGSKYTHAKKLGVKVIEESRFFKMIK